MARAGVKETWEKEKPATSQGMQKALNSSLGVLNKRLWLKIDSDFIHGTNKSSLPAYNITGTKISKNGHYRGLNMMPEHIDQWKHERKSELIRDEALAILAFGHIDFLGNHEILPDDSIVKKLKMDEDYRNMNRLEFWLKYGE